MSDAAQGPGWWQASDGRWYPPDTPPAPGWWRASDGNWYPPAEQGAAGPAAGPVGATPTEPTPVEPVPPATPSPPTPVEPVPPTEPLPPTPTEPPPPTPDRPVPPVEPVPPAPGEPVPPPPAEPVPPAPTAAGAPAPVAAGAEAKKGGRGALVAVGIVVVVVLIAAVALVVTRKGDSGTVATGGSSSSGSGGGGGNGDSGGGNGKPNPDLSSEMPSSDITLADDVVVVDSKQGAMFKGFSDDGTAILLDKAAPGLDKLKTGDVLLLSGMTVVRVSDISQIDEGTVVTGSPVTLPEVVADGELSWDDVKYDPEKMRLRVWTPSEGSGGGGSDRSVGRALGSGVALGGGPAVAAPAVAAPAAAGPAVATPVVARVHGVEHTFALPAKKVSGKVADFSFDLSYDPEGSGHHLQLTLDSAGDLDGKIDIDVHLGALASSGGAKVNGKQVRNFDFTFGDLGGEAKITTELRSTKQLTSVMTPPFLQVPFSVEFPALVGGIPFTLSFTGTIQVQLSMAMANASLGGEVHITFGGDAGLHFDGGKMTVNGKRQQDAEDLVNTVKGLANGPVGVVVTAELPKVGFGFGFLQTGAGVYLSSGMVAQQSILPAPAACTGLQIAYVLAAGVEAKFLGKEFDIGRKAVVDKRWDYTVPKSERCTPPS